MGEVITHLPSFSFSGHTRFLVFAPDKNKCGQELCSTPPHSRGYLAGEKTGVVADAPGLQKRAQGSRRAGRGSQKEVREDYVSKKAHQMSGPHSSGSFG